MTRPRESIELVQHHHETKMQVWTRRIDPEFDAQRTPRLQSLSKIGDGFDVIETVEQLGGGHARTSTMVTPVEPSSSLP